MTALGHLRWRIFHQDAPLAELFLICQGIAWGSLVLGVRDAHLRSAVLRSMERVVPEDVAGFSFLVIGILGLFSWLGEVRKLRMFCALLGTFGWTFVGIMSILTVPPATGAATFLLSGLFSGLVLVRLAGLVDVHDDV